MTHIIGAIKVGSRVFLITLAFWTSLLQGEDLRPGARSERFVPSAQSVMRVADLPSLPQERSLRKSGSPLQASSLSPSNPFLSPLPSASFLALPDSNDRTPPDTQGAASQDHLMVALNTSIRFQRRNGDFVRTAALSSFWSSVGNVDPFDPRCVFDPVAQRWILIACANRFSPESCLLVGTSQTSDPSGSWNLFRMNTGGMTNWIDYPTLGFNGQWIVVQALMKTIAGNQFYESQIFVFDKLALYNGTRAAHTLFRRTDIGTTQTVAQTLDLTEPKVYLINSPVSEPVAQSLNLFAVQGTVGNEQLAFMGRLTAPIPWGTKAPGSENLAPQLNTTNRLHLQDSSIQNVVVRNGFIWCVQHVFLPPEAPTRSAIQWWQLSNNEIVQQGRIDDPDNGQFYAYPSLAVNQFSDLLIGYSRFSSNQFASANYSFRLASDPLGSVRSDTVFKSGEGPYLKTRNTGKNRWGDYSSTVVDPVDDRSFWTIQTYAAQPDGDPATDGSGRWGTWWAHVGPNFNSVDIQLKGAISTAVVQQPFTARWTVINTGPEAASVALATVEIPAGAEILAASSSSGQVTTSQPVVHWSLENLPAGAQASLTVTLRTGLEQTSPLHARVITRDRDLVPANNTIQVPLGLEPDADRDGLSDSWENTHQFSNSDPGDAAQDSDGDGHSNLSEFRAGTLPRNPLSLLNFLSFEVVGEQVEFSFQSAKGKLYRIEWKERLPAAPWMPVVELEGTGQILRAAERLRGAHGLYRLVALP